MNGKEQRIAKLNALQQPRKQDCIDRKGLTVFNNYELNN